MKFALVWVVVALATCGSLGARIQRDDGSETWLQRLFDTVLGRQQETSTTATGTTPSSEIMQNSTFLQNTTELPENGTATFSAITEADDKTGFPATTEAPDKTGFPATTEADDQTMFPTAPPPEDESVVLETSTTNEYLSTTVSTNPECLKANDMKTYCELAPTFEEYMNHNTTAGAMASKLFCSHVIQELIQNCKPGNWCLSDSFIGNFSNSMTDIFGGPMCSEGLRECVNQMVFMRSGCPDMMWLSTFADSLTLVCSMNAIPELTPECFGHTLATLHVTLADKIRDSPQDMQQSGEFCLGSYVGMTRKFMCTMEKCPHHQQLFRDFAPWQWFMDDAPAIKKVCKLESVCGDKEAIAEENITTTTTMMTTSVLYPNEQTTEVSDDGFNADVRPEQPIFIIQTTDQYTRLLIGIATGTIIVVLLVMVLVCALLRRLRRRTRLQNKEGYTKLPSEEVQ